MSAQRDPPRRPRSAEGRRPRGPGACGSSLRGVVVAAAALALVVSLRTHPAMRPPSCLRGRTASSCWTSRQASRTRRTRGIAATLDRLARSRGRYGLVLFSDTAYQALPPGTPARGARHVRAILRRTEADDAPAARLSLRPTPGRTRSARALGSRPGSSSRSTSSATRHLGRPGVVLVSDLDDDAGDIEALTNVALAYRKLGIPLRVVGLSPSPEDQRLLDAAPRAPGRPAARDATRRARGRVSRRRLRRRWSCSHWRQRPLLALLLALTERLRWEEA